MGYHRAGFDVVGVDINPQPNYPFRFVQADALDPPFDLAGFAAIHASPPCQAYSTITPDPTSHERTIPHVRELLRSVGQPYVIENVEGARRDLDNPIRLCGSSFGLGVRRHRYFEVRPEIILVPPCDHLTQGRPIGVYGDHPQNDFEYRRPNGQLRGAKANSIAEAQAAMGMPWADWYGCTQAIPPAYTEWIGTQLLAHLELVDA